MLEPEMIAKSEDDDKSSPWHDWHEPERATALLQRMGFARTGVKRAMHSTTFNDLHALWETMTNTSPMFDLSTKGDDEIARLERQFGEFMGVSEDSGALFLLTASNIVYGFLE